MGRLIRASVPALLALAGCGAAGRDKGLQPALSSAEILDQELEPRRIAVLVGVDRYDDPAFPALKHAGHDATALGEALRRSEGGGFDQVLVLTGDDVTRERVARALRELKETSRREDAVVVYFSGHGTRVLDDDGWHRFLLVKDSRARDLEATALDLAVVQGWFSALPAARKALIVDSCFSGDGKSVIRPDTLGEGKVVEMGDVVPNVAALGSGELQMFATTSGRPSREDDRLGHGVYTYYLLEAMGWGFQDADVDRDRVVTAWEAHDYARTRTMAFTEGVQIPEAALRVVGEADLVLAGDPGQRQAREQALVYLYTSHGPWQNAKISVDGRDRGALPGVVPIEPGRHHVAVTAESGAVLLEGFARLDAQEYRIEELQWLVGGADRALAVRPAFLWSLPLRPILGSGAAGLEVAWTKPLARTGSWSGELVLGGAASPGRLVEGVPLRDARPVLWGAYSVGLHGDVQRLRWHAGLGASLVLAPPDYVNVYEGHPDPAYVPSEAGWWLVGAGPSAGAGWRLDRGWSLDLEARTHLAALDVGEGTGPVPYTTWGLGLAKDW